jgi:hypothetical protein
VQGSHVLTTERLIPRLTQVLQQGAAALQICAAAPAALVAAVRLLVVAAQRRRAPRQLRGKIKTESLCDIRERGAALVELTLKLRLNSRSGSGFLSLDLLFSLFRGWFGRHVVCRKETCFVSKALLQLQRNRSGIVLYYGKM